jgi:ORF6N domain
MSDAADKQSSTQLMPLEAIALRIVNLRGQRVILDSDLAALYEVPTKRFNEAVKRNIAKFPSDFMFQLDNEEFDSLRSQFATSNVGRGGRRYAPRVFNEHGALMAATVLNSPRAVQVSVYVIRAFVKLRELAASHQDFAKRLDEIEAKNDHTTLKLEAFANVTRRQLKEVFEALRQLTTTPDPPKRPIGFVYPEENNKPKTKTAKG